ncbi:MAG TPA: patatin-like phospholipase family protein [Coriobacteriia bacterium]|nr:patatin-like phospholipase family protein [Coriobacteriia bacterium]
MRLFGPRTLGLALGGGSARGLAHIGVLKVLDAEGLAPDILTGTSMGAVVGALYAAGMTPAEIEKIAVGLDMRAILGLADVAIRKGAMLSGDKIEAFLAERLPATFEELSRPFGCVATDLTKGTVAEFTSGDLVTAVRASMSVPLVFVPVRTDDALYVDGFVTEPVPVALAERLGADVVAAVEVAGSGTVTLGSADEKEQGFIKTLHAALAGEESWKRGTSSLEIAVATLETFERRITEASIAGADLVISPEVHGISGFEFMAAERIIAAGEAAARGAVEQVRRKARR